MVKSHKQARYQEKFLAFWQRTIATKSEWSTIKPSPNLTEMSVWDAIESLQKIRDVDSDSQVWNQSNRTLHVEMNGDYTKLVIRWKS